MTALEASASTRRRCTTVSPSARSAGASPWSPLVATTRTTRCPSDTARAIEPDVWDASSSGWAWTNTTVAMGAASHPSATPTTPRSRAGPSAQGHRVHDEALVPREPVVEAARRRVRLVGLPVDAAAPLGPGPLPHRLDEGGRDAPPTHLGHREEVLEVAEV